MNILDYLIKKNTTNSMIRLLIMVVLSTTITLSTCVLAQSQSIFVVPKDAARPLTGQQDYYVTEYAIVTISSSSINHAGYCERRQPFAVNTRAREISVIINGSCLGGVGQLLQMTRGSYEFSVDAIGAETKVVYLRNTSRDNPQYITVNVN